MWGQREIGYSGSERSQAGSSHHAWSAAAYLHELMGLHDAFLSPSSLLRLPDPAGPMHAAAAASFFLLLLPLHWSAHSAAGVMAGNSWGAREIKQDAMGTYTLWTPLHLYTPTLMSKLPTFFSFCYNYGQRCDQVTAS